MKKPLVVALLGSAQTLAWASSYYLVALLAAPMARDTGLDEPTVFLAFSLALVASAFVGPWAGRIIDRHGGRSLLMGTSVLFAAGLSALGLAHGPWGLFAAWALMGLAMGSGLYDAAFATLVKLYGHRSRSLITGITLIAGFASTVGWPLTAWMEATHGWRNACFGWAALHLVLGLPLNAALPTAPDPSIGAEPAQPPAQQPQRRNADTQHPTLVGGVLAFVFAVAWFTSTAMAAHLPRLMQTQGVGLAVAVAVGALVGPAQVAGRLLEFGVLRRVHPLLSARLANLAHPLGALSLIIAGPAAAPFFAVLHGAGNGILTIAKGTLPLVFFGAQGYGARQGWLMLPGRVAQAFAPFAFGLALDRWGASSLWLSAALGLAAFAALMALRATGR